MSCDWPLVKLDELANEITVGFVGSMKHEYVDKGVPFFRSKNISEYEIEWYDIRYISPAFHRRLKKSVLRPGDVAIVRTGKPGTACVIPDSVDEANCSDIVIVRVNNDKLSAHYLCYFMNSVASHQVSSHLVGAVQQHFNVASVKTIKIPLPKRDEQEEIVKILKALDDKRKINRKINHTLEAMAQAIFKSWFVDFEPVKAKIAAVEAGENAEGITRAAMSAISGKTDEELDQLQAEQPEHYTQLKTTAELFPAAMQDSELGEIPEGWEVKSLYDCAQYINGAAFKSEDFSSNQEGLPIIKISELKYGITSQTEFTKKVFDKKYRIINGEILFSWSGSPDTSIDIFLWTGGTGWLNQHTFRVIPQETEEKEFIFFLLKFFKRSFIELARNKQTTGLGHVTSKDLKNTFVAFPMKKVIKLFNDIGEPIVSQIFCNSMENNNLSKIRDLLLPELLSGELEINTVNKAES